MKTIALACGLCLLVACEVEEFGVGANSITVRNEDPGSVEVLIADGANCFAGTRSSLSTKTTRMFDVSDEAFVCLNGAATKATPNATYVIRGGAITVEAAEVPF